MVLRRALLLIALVGCSKSLFDDSHGGDGGGGDAGAACPAPCIANAAGDFDGTPAPAHWRFLDDHRDRTWAPMSASGGALVGADPANTISTCAAHAGTSSCAALPGALLVSTSGATSAADPAIEFTAPMTQVIQLGVHARFDAGGDQTIRLYRNSREDVLVTGLAVPGTTLDQTIAVDAIAGDRFLVAVAPTAAGASDVAVQVFVTDSGKVFPSNCQLAAAFDAVDSGGIKNLCGPTGFVDNDFNAGTMIAPALGAGPFAEQHMAADIVPNTFYTGGDILDKANDVTIQMWVRLDTVDPVNAGWAFSDYDLDNAGGVGVVFYDQSGVQLEVSTCTSPNPLSFLGEHVPYAADGMWHFIRVVHTNGNVTTCVDGKKVMTFPLAAGKLMSTFKPYMGKNVVWTPAGAFFDGGLDDVRVFSTALACQ